MMIVCGLCRFSQILRRVGHAERSVFHDDRLLPVPILRLMSTAIIANGWFSRAGRGYDI
jgi:hypothetical protein